MLALLAWQGHHVAHWLPQLESTIAELGPWGPLGLIGAILALGPLLVPDSLFGIAAGVSFGLGAGTTWYFLGLDLMCLAVHSVAAHWLQEPVLRRLEQRPALRAAVLSVRRGGARSAFLVRLVPMNQALLSYALGAAGVPLRSALLGNVAMLAHVVPTVYFGAAAAHVTRMAAQGHRRWEAEGVVLMVGLGACVWLTLHVTRRAWAAVAAQAARADGDGAAAGTPRPPAS